MEKFNFTNGSNVTFHQGYIEDLKDIGTSTVDVVVSNCVVNLSPRKDLVMKEIFRVLKDGGEFYFSDVFVDRRLPSDIAFDPLLHSECLEEPCMFETLLLWQERLDSKTLESSLQLQ